MSLPEIARTTGIPIPTLRDWAVHGIFCPPLDISPPTAPAPAPGYGDCHRDIVTPWLSAVISRPRNAHPKYMHSDARCNGDEMGLLPDMTSTSHAPSSSGSHHKKP